MKAPRISKRKQNALLGFFASDTTAMLAAEKCHVNVNTANLYYRHFREAIYRSQRRAPRFFGEVEMDQAQFGGRGRKRMQALIKRYSKVLSHHDFKIKAAAIRKEVTVNVFGIMQRGGDVYCHLIKKMDSRTLAALVRLVVEENSTVYTDKWRGFTDLGINGYTHKDINHSESYSDKNGVHINGIETFWSYAKRRLGKFNGIARTTLALHVKECEWRYNHPDTLKDLKALLSQDGSSAEIRTTRLRSWEAAPMPAPKRSTRAIIADSQSQVPIRRFSPRRPAT